MAKSGLVRLRDHQKFKLEGKNDVIIQFGKYNGKKFSQIAKIEPEYFQFLLDTQDGKVSQEIRKRLLHWTNKSLNFWI